MRTQFPKFASIRQLLRSLRTHCSRSLADFTSTGRCSEFLHRRHRLSVRKRVPEVLEQRLLLTLNVGLSSGNLLVQETSGGVDQLTISFDGDKAEYVFHDPGQILTTTINSAEGDQSHTIRVPADRVAGNLLQVLSGSNSDTITVAAGFSPPVSMSLKIDAGEGSDIVRWNSGKTFSTIAVTAESAEIDAATLKTTASQTWTATVTLLRPVELLGKDLNLQSVQASTHHFTVIGSGHVSVAGNITAMQNAAVIIEGQGGINLSPGSLISTELGSLTLNAPLQEGNAGNISGILIEDASVRTKGGHLTLTAATTAAASAVSAIDLKGAQLLTEAGGTLSVTGVTAIKAAAWGLRAIPGAQRTSIITHDGSLLLSGISGESGDYSGTVLEGALIRTTGNGAIIISADSRSIERGLVIDDGCNVEANGAGSISISGAGTAAQTAKVTFDGLSGTTASPWIEGGLRFESAAAFKGNFPQGMVGSTAASGFVDITSTDGRAFNVFSLDVSENNGSINSRTITFTGFPVTGGVIQKSFTTNSGFDREKVVLDGFTNLSKLRYTFDSTTWDDIEFSFVSEGRIGFGNATVRAVSGNVQLNTSRVSLFGTLTVDVGSDIVWSQEFTGPGLLSKIGQGSLTLSGASSHTGGTLITSGLLHVSGSLTSNVVVVTTGRMVGSGILYAPLDILASGSLEPGGIPGVLESATLTLHAQSTLRFDLGGTSPGESAGNHDQIVVSGTLTVAGSLNLTLINGFQPAAGDTFVLIANDGSDAVSGTFTGLPQDAEFTVDGKIWKISYTGGSGNDVELSCVGQQYVVTNLNSSGAGSLFRAMADANATSGMNVIVFAVAGLIEVTASYVLPILTDSVRIDATTAPGFNGSPVIEISGIAAGLVPGIVFGAGSVGSHLRGLSIVRFARAGVEIHAPHVTISGNRIGLTRTGASAGNGTAGGTAATGILVAAMNARIGGDLPEDANVISGNIGTGIRVSGSQTTGVSILRNLIGTSPGGEQAIGNTGGGITLDPGVSGTQIGAPGSGNLISGNLSHGILADTAPETVISGNRIGTNAGGSTAISGNGIGVWLRGAVEGTRIGGSSAEAGNLISGNGSGGILVTDMGGGSDPAVDSIVISANRIGTNANSNASIRNRNAGIRLTNGATGVLIGTRTTSGNGFIGRNLISGNEYFGVLISGSDTHGNTVAGNWIGTTSSGNARLGNWDAGVAIFDGAHQNIIGIENGDDGDSAAANLILGDQRGSGFGALSTTWSPAIIWEPMRVGRRVSMPRTLW